MAAHYGWAHLHDLGLTLIMPNEVLNHIVDCAHFHKINSTTELKNETRWDEIDQCADGVLEIIRRLQPQSSVPPPLTTTPMRVLATPMCPSTTALNVASPSPSTTLVNPAAMGRSKSRCSACGLVGHNGELLFSLTVVLVYYNIGYSTQSNLQTTS